MYCFIEKAMTFGSDVSFLREETFKTFEEAYNFVSETIGYDESFDFHDKSWAIDELYKNNIHCTFIKNYRSMKNHSLYYLFKIGE
jgi:hypothetical protein